MNGLVASNSETLAALVAPSMSIVITNYNYGRFLEQAIQSAVQQTYSCEVLVVDDGSTDDSDQLLARWADRVRVLRQTNGGQSAAYNTGFAASHGDVVIFLDADDYLVTDAAASLATAFDAGVAKVHYRLLLVDGDGVAMGAQIPSALASGQLGERLTRFGLLHASAPGSGNAYRRSVLERLFPIPVTQADPIGADFFTIFGSALFGEVRAIARPLAYYRVHAAADARMSFVFQNSAHDGAEIARVTARKARFRQWIADRTQGSIQVPVHLTSFSERKSQFLATLTQAAGLVRLREGASQLPGLVASLWSESERSVWMRGALSGWMLLSVALPRRWADPIVRYVANPASRRSVPRIMR